MELPEELAEAAALQDGIVTRPQVIGSGLTDATIRHALRKGGEWQRIVWGVYATFTGRIDDRHRLRGALLYAGDDAVVSGAAACRCFGMGYVPDCDVPLLLVPKSVKRAKISIARIRRVKQMPSTRTLGGIPCVAPERAVLDAVRYAKTLRDARAALAEVVQRRLTTVDRLVRELEHMDGRGMRFAERALSDVLEGARSAPECDLQDIMRRSRLFPKILWNVPLPEDGNMIPDGQIREYRIVIEVDSTTFHGFGEMPELTERRRARFASLGWRVIPVSPQRIREEPDTVRSEIEAACRAEVPRTA